MPVGLAMPPIRLLRQTIINLDEEIAKAITEVVWNVPTNIRDSINIIKMQNL